MSGVIDSGIVVLLLDHLRPPKIGVGTLVLLQFLDRLHDRREIYGIYQDGLVSTTVATSINNFLGLSAQKDLQLVFFEPYCPLPAGEIICLDELKNRADRLK
jgi:hypothetical protein